MAVTLCAFGGPLVLEVPLAPGRAEPTQGEDPDPWMARDCQGEPWIGPGAS